MGKCLFSIAAGGKGVLKFFLMIIIITTTMRRKILMTMMITRTKLRTRTTSCCEAVSGKVEEGKNL